MIDRHRTACIRRPRCVLIAACLTLIVGATDGFSQAPTSDTIHVVPPTGEAEADRSSIQAAFDAVHPGGTVQFAPGTYLLGAGARLTVPDVTVLGHPDGTILRGCDPEAFGVEDSKIEQVVFGCTGLYVQAERQTIRGLTFEYTWHGIVVGPFPISAEEAAALGEHDQGLPPAYPASGQRIEGNTFRATPNGLRVLGTGTDTSVVRLHWLRILPILRSRACTTTTSSTSSTPSGSTARRSTSLTTA